MQTLMRRPTDGRLYANARLAGTCKWTSLFSIFWRRLAATPVWDTLVEEDFDEGEFVELFARTATKPKAKQEKAKVQKIKVR